MADDRNESVAVRVIYTGRVQGVGFRATAVHIARKHPVTGWVRNLPDGRVELWAEGREPTVISFLQDIRDHWGMTIKNEAAESQPPADCSTFMVIGQPP